MLKKILLILPLIPKLGYWNVAYMVWYRLGMRMGWRKRKFPVREAVPGPFYSKVEPLPYYPEEWKAETLERADRIMEGELTWFHYHPMQAGNPPKWFRNPFDGSELRAPEKHWTELGDFDLNTGDVKILWEPSRFDWLTNLARAYRITGKKKYLETINTWLADWSAHNPLNQGPNWKCGQETAIRVMKLITVAQILNQDTKAAPGLRQMIYQHVERIAGNINYAMVQDNNHGTSEAAGMYIGAVWLIHQNESNSTPILQKWKAKGRKALENRILKLIAPQGTFAQRSVNYHRMVVDTMSWVLYAMDRYQEPAFSDQIQDRLEKLGEWLYKMIATPDGQVPNIGANDGAMLETLHNQDYRDFRPSTQLFFGVFKNQRVFGNPCCDEVLFWRYPDSYRYFRFHTIETSRAEILDEQFLIMQSDDTKVFLKIPNDQFRPSASDAFHLDLWNGGQNLLGDSGSFCYNAGEETDWYKSVQAHNTLQFGEGQQMAKISRFLYGYWIKAEEHAHLHVGEDRVSWFGSYSDERRNTHQRSLEWEFDNRQLTITDEFRQSNQEPVKLYWHLNCDRLDTSRIRVKTDEGEALTSEATTTENSLYYLQKQKRRTLVYTAEGHRITTLIHY